MAGKSVAGGLPGRGRGGGKPEQVEGPSRTFRVVRPLITAGRCRKHLSASGAAASPAVKVRETKGATRPETQKASKAHR